MIYIFKTYFVEWSVEKRLHQMTLLREQQSETVASPPAVLAENEVKASVGKILSKKV